MAENLPKITVVTPSYNQSQFIEQTILSVIGQQYPNLEYIIMDGGSTDASVEIIKKYEPYISHWQSKKDNGQAAAINEGLSMATGDILCWLNSDDMYMPGALLTIGRLFKDIDSPAIAFGNCLHFHEGGQKTRGSDVVARNQSLDLKLCGYIIQPSSFWNRPAWEQTGKLNEELHYAFDWEWFIRAMIQNVQFKPVKNYLSLYRIHDMHKSGTGGEKRAIELGEIYKKYNDEGIKKAFLKWDRMSRSYKLFHNIVYTSDKYNLDFISKAIHLMFFRFIDYKSFKHIIKM